MAIWIKESIRYWTPKEREPSKTCITLSPQEKRQAIIDASCQRLRAVLLTSLTTIGGLPPIKLRI